MILLSLLLFFCVVELVILIVVLRRAVAVAQERQALYDFFEDTLEDIDSVIAMFDKLMKRQMLSDDSDVQSLYRVLGITHDILMDYRNAHKERSEK